MKRYRNHPELAHAWANGLSMNGKCGTMYFEDNRIYSYGSHYEIARLVAAPNGIRFAFINANGYGNSTAKHTNHVLHAIPHGIRSVYVPFFRRPLSGSHYFEKTMLPDIVPIMMQEVDELVQKQLRARDNYYYFGDAQRRLAEVIAICESFNVPIPKLPPDWDKAEAKADLLRTTKEHRETKRQEKQKQAELEKLERWLKGEKVGSLYNVPVHLRFSDGGEWIETTKGARVRTETALAMLDKLKARQASKGDKLDGYTLLGYDDKEVTIGCHKIGWDVIDKLFKVEATV